jgi:polysaccharide biosynthesis transport protein
MGPFGHKVPASVPESTVSAAPPLNPTKGLLLPAGSNALRVRAKAAPAVLTNTPNVVGILQALRRRWALALTLGLLGASVAASAVWMSQKALFTARTLLLVHSSQPVILSNIRNNQPDFANYQRTQIALVKSRFVLNAALRNPKVAALPVIQEKLDPVAWLEKEIQVDFGVAPEILRIALTGEDPEELKKIVDAVRMSYFTDIVSREKIDASKRLSKLQALFKDYDSGLQIKRNALKAVANNLGSKEAKSLEMTYEFGLKRLDGIRSELSKTQFDLLRAKMNLALEQNKINSVAANSGWNLFTGFPFEEIKENLSAVIIPESLLEEALKKHPNIVKHTRAIAESEAYIQDFESSATEDPKNTKDLAKQRRVLEKNKVELDDLRQKLRPELTVKLREQFIAEVRARIDVQKLSVAYLTGMEEMLVNDWTKSSNALAEFKANKLSAEDLREEIANSDSTAKNFANQINALEIELNAPDRVDLLEDAVAIPDSDSRVKKAGMAGAGVFVVIVLGVALLEFRKRLVNTVEDVVRGLEMPLMGTVPAIPENARRGMGTSGNEREMYWQSLLTESVDAARTMLLHMAQQESLKVVMVTSAVGGEGKTLLSCHLAASMARAGYRTVLVDCDLRRPAVHRLFNLPAEPGFSDLLRKQGDAAAMMQTGPLENLSILPAGHSDPAAFQALAQHQATEIFKSLKEQYDFVIVDSAPILAVADSLLIGQCVDGVVFSILRDVSRLPMVYNAYERLAALRVRILGAVVNGTAADYYRARYSYRAGSKDTPAQESNEE